MTLLIAYENFCKTHNLQQTSDQLRVVETLTLLQKDLERKKKCMVRKFVPKIFDVFFDHQILKGIYIYGDVGRGKSMLMDLFYNQVKIQKKKRYHFHEFMQMIHSELNGYKVFHGNKKPSKHPLEILAKRLRQKAELICFDEFHFKDITDAMLLKRLMHFLWKEKVVVVATSNYHPLDLYENGYQRCLIVPFLRQLSTNLEICHLGGEKDYRQFMNGCDLNYIIAKPEEACILLKKRFDIDRGHAPIFSKTLIIKGRQWVLECIAGSLVLISFQEICGQNLGSVDYLELTDHMEALYISSVPQLNDENLDKVKRFIGLVDILYHKEKRLIMTAAVPLEDLYRGQKEALLFKRTLSRLAEMNRHKV